jgi:hypothetical protein
MTDTADHITIRLRGPADLERLHQGVRFVAGKVGEGWSVVFTRLRTNPQNARLHAMLDAIRAHWRANGQRVRTREHMKAVFMKALRAELVVDDDFYEGSGVVVVGYKTSELSVEQFSELFALIEAWAAENNIELGETE